MTRQAAHLRRALGSKVDQMSEIKVRNFSSNDWELYKSIRLRSLMESPDAFGSTYEEEVLFSNDKWLDRVNVGSRTKDALPLLAELDGQAMGLACGVIHSVNDKYAMVYQMWVDPSVRGQGVGKALLKRIMNWAAEARMHGVKLDVTTSNEGALKLYSSAGFVDFGEPMPLRSGSKLCTQSMVCMFRGNAA